MEDSSDDLAARDLGRALVFVSVGAVSAFLLFFGVRWLREQDPVGGILAITGSVLFWWPLFRLGMYHARKGRRVPGRP
ncbi:MAG TPA: hypothetical protein VKW04_20380 [Planctomycetota bacterium]|nr:hypothetical protein [Planctomycetota bacterium]